MYPESGISKRERRTRTGIRSSDKPRKCGADAPKNELGRTGAPLSATQTVTSVSSRNGFCITAAILSQSELGTLIRLSSHTRSRCPESSRETILLAREVGLLSSQRPCSITMGKRSKVSGISVTGLFPVYSSCRSRGCRDANTKRRHLWQTWISVYQSYLFACQSFKQRLNIPKRALPGSMLIETWSTLDRLFQGMPRILSDL
ncbi:hypothetical protein F5148DRAFT_1177697 [Russula earlei]|uniref:Uncharacterized protein n=1 Tax=Russula earlei TaxID=71964 RepID=A0ACC0UHE8_9AGAM|nr:hypothetical protein F5148DRAFT_1177697 [Russula earlei]